MSKAKAKPKSRSGTNLTDKQREVNGWGRLSLRLPTKTLEKLTALAKESGYTRSQLIETMIELDYKSRPKR